MKIAALLLISYLLGSIPTGLWIGQAFYHTNLREHGSGNTGTTNTFRVLGVKAGMVVLAVDILKGTLAVLLPVWFGVTTVTPLVFGFLAILGHTFPVFAQFKGGKAVATSAGVLLGFAPGFFLYLALIFVGSLYLFSMISFSSITAAVLGIFAILVFPAFHILFSGYDLLFSLIVLAMAIVILVRHKDNMSRIKNKEENLVPWGLNLTHQKPKIKK